IHHEHVVQFGHPRAMADVHHAVLANDTRIFQIPARRDLERAKEVRKSVESLSDGLHVSLMANNKGQQPGPLSDLLVLASLYAAPVECNALSGVRCGTDHVDNELGVGQHWYVTAGDLVNRSPHAFRDEALQVGRHGAVIRGHDVPTRLRLPRCTSSIL